MKDNSTVQRDERALEHGLKRLKLPIFLTVLNKALHVAVCSPVPSDIWLMFLWLSTAQISRKADTSSSH